MSFMDVCSLTALVVRFCCMHFKNGNNTRLDLFFKFIDTDLDVNQMVVIGIMHFCCSEKQY